MDPFSARHSQCRSQIKDAEGRQGRAPAHKRVKKILFFYTALEGESGKHDTTSFLLGGWKLHGFNTQPTDWKIKSMYRSMHIYTQRCHMLQLTGP